jgi:hypothetical protein
MRRRVLRSALLAQLLVAVFALLPVAATAQPANGPRETVDQRLTTKQTSSATGGSFNARYHAAGNKNGAPPPLRRMVFYAPSGMRYDTSVPARCTASDVELQARGPAACPAGSRLGGGTVEGLFYVPFAHSVLFDHYHHTVDVMNGANEQIVLIKSEGWTVVRGRVRPDNSIDFTPTTCFPASPTGKCADEYIIQLASSTVLAPYKKTVGGRVRSYATTPAKCPAGGNWSSTVRFWWADGAVDSVVNKWPCTPPRKHH